MTKNLLTRLLGCSILFIGVNAKSQVVINEYSASNLSQFVDNHSDYGDWVELYNPSGSTINLGGYYLSDDSTNHLKYQIPNGVTIPANGFVRFWCDGRNEWLASAPTQPHTNFKLKQTKNNKEDLVLSDPTGIIIDGIRTAITQLGHSRGRKPDGSTTWGVFTAPTPNLTNNNATQYTRYADRPDFTVPAGFYNSSQVIVMTNTEPPGTSTMKYTMNGDNPTAASTAFTVPLVVNNTSVVKATTYSSDPTVLPSLMEFETYFINVSHTVPVIAVSGTSLTTLANGSGGLEPVGSFEYFDVAGTKHAESFGEFNKHGQDSWANSQRSLDFVSRDEMGYNHSVEHQIFKETPRSSFQRLILRASGDDNYPADHHTANLGSAHVRDAFVHMIAERGNMNVEVRLATKCVVYLNGNYWGVYDLRDNPDDHDNTEYYYGQDKYHLYMIKTWGSTWAEYGGNAALSESQTIYNYIMANNMADPAKYQWVIDRFDATSLVDYVLINGFSVCSDWLNWNTCWWRGLDSTQQHLRWGYQLWDNDATFGHYINYTGIPNTNFNADPCDVETINFSYPEDHIGILNKLRQNAEFNQYYISRYIDMWNTVWSCDNLIPYLDSIVSVIDPEMTAHAARWSGTYSEWQTNVATLRQFIIDRCNFMATGFVGCYNLNGPYDVTVDANPVGAGTVKFNTLNIDQFPWTGQYFGGMDNLLEAIPNPTWSFTNWSTITNTVAPNNTSINASVNLTADDSIVAHFTITSSMIENMGNEPTVNAYPTLTSGSTTLDISLPEATPVKITLTSMLGDKVAVINDQPEMKKGFYSMNVDFASSNLEPGVYIINVMTKNSKKALRIVYSPDIR